MINIALTGVTGLLGSNILFEIIKTFYLNKQAYHIYLFGRSSKGISFESRIKKELLSTGLIYIFGKESSDDEIIQEFLNNFSFIYYALQEDKLGLTQDDFIKISKTNFDAFIHCAAATGFANDQETFSKVNKVNVIGIKHILTLINEIYINKFIYVSSAYSSGRMSGQVFPDIQYQDPFFPNHYQKSKYDAELLVKDFSKSNKLNTLIFRPSTIGGRLIEEPFGAVNKYDVFLGFAKGFIKIKSVFRGSWINIVEDLYSIPLRMHIHPESGLNIVPVDFCAKLIVYAALNISKSQSYHLANHNFILHKKYFPLIFDRIKIEGVNYIDYLPNDQSEIERVYYDNLGAIFDHYITQPPLYFDNQSMKELEKASGVTCPEINHNTFNTFMDYAIKNNFGYLPSL